MRMAQAWAAEVAAGRDSLLLAYRRASVEALNQEARTAWEAMGQLSGPELEAPGGRRYRAGDRVIALAPGPGGAWATSQRAVVSSVDLTCSRAARNPSLEPSGSPKPTRRRGQTGDIMAVPSGYQKVPLTSADRRLFTIRLAGLVGG